MANTVDEKIVQLTLENKQFNKASKESIETLDDLKKALEFEGAVDSFDVLEKEIKKVDFDPMVDGVQTVSNQFNALNTIADAVLRNITNKVISTGEQLVSALTVDQISQGWAQYADRTTAVQRIMSATSHQFSSTEEQMEAVNAQLDKLIWFTDETSFKFNDMVNTIGKFTANNVDLETSVRAMEGISTWAALSGANINEAGRAMYNLAQALSIGAVKTMDWRSVQNANMDNTEFRDTAIEAALAAKTLTKQMNGMYQVGNKLFTRETLFSEGLSMNWFTSDVLISTLDAYGAFSDLLNGFVDETGVMTTTALHWVDQYIDGTLDMQKVSEDLEIDIEDLTKWMEKLGSDEMELGRRGLKAAQETKTFAEAIDFVKTAVSSGWAKSFEFIFGDYLEAKDWWSEVSEGLYEVFVMSGETRNAILKIWKDDGGREIFLEALRELGRRFLDIKGFFTGAWEQIFPEQTVKEAAQKLIDITQKFLEFAKAIKFTDETAGNLQDILAALIKMAQTIWRIIKTINRALFPMYRLINNIAGAILNMVGELARMINLGLENYFTEERLTKIYNAVNLIARLVSGLLQVGLSGVFSIIGEIGSAISYFWTAFQESSGGIKGIFEALTSTMKAFYDSIMQGESLAAKVVRGIILAFEGLVGGIVLIVSKIAQVVKGEISFKEIFDDLELEPYLEDLSKFIDNLNLGEKFGFLGDTLVNFATGVKQLIIDLQDADSSIRQLLNTIIDAFGTIWDRFREFLKTVTLEDLEKIAIIAMLFNYVNSLAAVNKSVSKLVNNVSGTVGTVNKLLKGLMGDLTLLDKVNTLMTTTKVMQIGISALLIVKALDNLNKLDYDRTVQSIAMLGLVFAGIIAVMTALSKFSKNLGDIKIEGLNTIGTQLLAVSLGLFAISHAMKVISDSMFGEDGSLDVAKLAVSIGAITVFVAELAGLIVLLGKIKLNKIKGTVAPLLAMAAAITILAQAVKILSQLDIAKMAASMGMIAVTIAALGAAMFLIGKDDWRSILSATVAITAVTGALTILSAVVVALSYVTNDLQPAFDMLLLTLFAVTASIAALGLVLQNVRADRIRAIAASFDLIALAMIGFAGSFLMLQKVDLNGIVDKLTTIGIIAGIVVAIFAIFSGFQASGIPLIDWFDKFSGSLVKFAGAMTLVSASLLLFNISLAAFTAIITGLGVIAKQFGEEFPELIRKGAEAFRMIFHELIQSLISMAGDIMVLVMAVLTAIAGAIILSKSNIALSVVAVGLAVLEAISLFGPDIVDTLVKLIDFIRTADRLFEALENLAERIGEYLIKTILKVMWGMIKGLFGGLADIVEDMIPAGYMADHYQEQLDGAIARLNDPTNNKAFKEAAYKQLESIREGYAKGTKGITDEMDEIARTAMETYDNSANDEAGINSPAEMTIEEGYHLQEGYKESSRRYRQLPKDAGKESVDAYAEGAEEEIDKRMPEVQKKLNDGLSDTASESTSSGVAKGVEEGLNSEEAAGVTGAIGNFISNLKEPIQGMIDNLLGDLDFDLSKIGVEGNFDIGLFSGFKKNKTVDVDQEVLGGMTRKQAELLGYNWDEISKRNRKKAKEAGEKDANEYTNEFLDSISGLGSGGSSGKLSSAMNKQVDAIAEAYSNAVKKINFDRTTRELQYKLWQSMNPNAADAEKTLKENQDLLDQVDTQLQIMNEAQKQYDSYVAAFGESSEKALESQQTLLKEQTKFYELQNKLQESNSKAVDNETEAFNLATQKLRDSWWMVEKGMFTKEDIWKEIVNEFGLNYMYDSESKYSNAVKGFIGNAADTAESVAAAMREKQIRELTNLLMVATNAGHDFARCYAEAVVDGKMDLQMAIDVLSDHVRAAMESSKAIKDAEDWGAMLAVGAEGGVEKNADKPVDAVKDMDEEIISESRKLLGIASPSQVFYNMGEMIIEGLRQALENGRSTIVRTIVGIVRDAIDAARAAAGIHSPSDEMYEVGRYFDLGLAYGILGYSNKVQSASNNLIEGALKTVQDNSEEVHSELRKLFDMDDELYLRVVVDADVTKARDSISALEAMQTKSGYFPGGSFRNTNSAFSSNYTNTILQDIYSKLDMLATEQKFPSISSSSEPAVVNNNFTQNNYSPKAISRVDTYRQTQRQFQQFTNRFDRMKR